MAKRRYATTQETERRQRRRIVIVCGASESAVAKFIERANRATINADRTAVRGTGETRKQFAAAALKYVGLTVDGEPSKRDTEQLRSTSKVCGVALVVAPRIGEAAVPSDAMRARNVLMNVLAAVDADARTPVCAVIDAESYDSAGASVMLGLAALCTANRPARGRGTGGADRRPAEVFYCRDRNDADFDSPVAWIASKALEAK